ncbi:hypothetical protein GF325_01280 [Candidatus Bathyarchaeota archaeon]|nr:hypothetical protein [Candidatus Bathyarchaeota archaeon]
MCQPPGVSQDPGAFLRSVPGPDRLDPRQVLHAARAALPRAPDAGCHTPVEWLARSHQSPLAVPAGHGFPVPGSRLEHEPACHAGHAHGGLGVRASLALGATAIISPRVHLMLASDASPSLVVFVLVVLVLVVMLFSLVLLLFSLVLLLVVPLLLGGDAARGIIVRVPISMVAVYHVGSPSPPAPVSP